MGAHRRLEQVPVRRRVGADRGAGDGEAAACGVDGDVAGAERGRERLAVALGAEHEVDRLADQLAHDRGVEGVDGGGEVVDRVLVEARDHAGGGVPLGHPRAAQLVRDRLLGAREDGHRHALAAPERRVDHEVVPAVRRMELADDEAVTHAGASAGRSTLRQRISPAMQSPRNTVYTTAVRYSSRSRYSGT